MSAAKEEIMTLVERINNLIGLAEEIGTFADAEKQLTNLVIAELITYIWLMPEGEGMEATIVTNSPSGRRQERAAHYDLLVLTAISSRKSVCVPLENLSTAYIISVLKAAAYYEWNVTSRTSKDHDCSVRAPAMGPQRFLELKSRLASLLVFNNRRLDEWARERQHIIPTRLFRYGMERVTKAAHTAMVRAEQGKPPDADWASVIDEALV